MTTIAILIPSLAVFAAMILGNTWADEIGQEEES